MKLFLLEPEVAGGLGQQTIIEKGKNIKLTSESITHLHYEFEGWLGDELLESFPTFIISDELAKMIKCLGLDDFMTQEVTITKSDFFEGVETKINLPQFKRLLPTGQIDVENKSSYENWTGHHFSLTQDGSLVVTEVVLEIMKSRCLNYCDIFDIFPK